MDTQMDLFYSLRQESTKWARSDQSSTNEFGRYIGTDWINTMGPEEFKQFDILAWWKGRESQFLVLAAMAWDLLKELLHETVVATGEAYSISDEEIALDEAASDARSSEAEEEDVNLEQALN
ncbi:zinc finger BED domain-containing protein RICESLEEPER 2 [Tanacetum coccineum]